MTSESAENNTPIEEILDTIGDPRARTILASISREPRPVGELAEDLGYARSTIYQRLDELEEHDLVTPENRIAPDGNHYQVFKCNFESTVISLEGDEYDVRIFRRENLPGRFTDLWDDLSRD